MSKFGIFGFRNSEASGALTLTTMISLLSGGKTKFVRPPPTPEQLKAQALQTERDEWNAKVEARKQAKKGKEK